MENLDLLIARQKVLLEKLAEENLSEKERKICDGELNAITDHISRIQEIKLKEDEFKEKLKHQKFDDKMRIVESVVPIVKFVGGVFVLVGFMQLDQEFDMNGRVISSNWGKLLASGPGTLFKKLFI